MFHEIYTRVCKGIDIARENLQLYGIACFHIAYKYNYDESVSYVDVDDLVWMCANTYTKQQIISKENEIINFFDWRFKPLDGYAHDANIKALCEISPSFTAPMIYYLYYTSMTGYQADKLVGYHLTPIERLRLVRVITTTPVDYDAASEILDQIKFINESFAQYVIGAHDFRGPSRLAKISKADISYCHDAVRAIVNHFEEQEVTNS